MCGNGDARGWAVEGGGEMEVIGFAVTVITVVEGSAGLTFENIRII